MARAAPTTPIRSAYPATARPATEYLHAPSSGRAGTGTDERTGVIAALNWEPTDNFKAKVDYFDSEFDRDDQRTGITASGFREDASANTIVTEPVIENGVITSATISAVDPEYASGGRDHPWFEARTEDQTTVADSTPTA